MPWGTSMVSLLNEIHGYSHYLITWQELYKTHEGSIRLQRSAKSSRAKCVSYDLYKVLIHDYVQVIHGIPGQITQKYIAPDDP